MQHAAHIQAYIYEGRFTSFVHFLIYHISGSTKWIRLKIWAYLEYPLVHMCAKDCGYMLGYTALAMTHIQSPNI
jgi:hypothetical protein